MSEGVGIIVTEFPEHAQRTVVQNTLGREGIFLEVLMLSLVLDQRTKSLEERNGSGGAFLHLPVPPDQTYAQSQHPSRLPPPPLFLSPPSLTTPPPIPVHTYFSTT